MTHRCIIIPASVQANAQALCKGLAGAAGDGMFTTGLAAKAKISTTKAKITALYASIDVSDPPPFVAMARLGLQIVQVPLP